MNLLPIILLGGAGTCLWPVSRESNTKPFLRLPDGQTLLEKTYRRALALPRVGEVFTVTNRNYYFRCRDEYLSASWTINAAPQAYCLFESFGCNTALAIALVALEAENRHGVNSMMFVLASHLIFDDAAFAEAVEKAVQLAGRGHLVTFGITPTAPETGFGYIQQGKTIDNLGYRVARFVEKPDLDTAQSYLAGNAYTWNSGMFCFTVRALLQALAEHAPEILDSARIVRQAANKNIQTTDDYSEFPAEVFRQLPDDSIYYALMGKSTDIAVVRGSFDWSDMGSWDALAGLIPPDEQGNRIIGEVVAISTQNTNHRRHIGLQDMIDIADALLVVRSDQLEQVKDVISSFIKQGHEFAHTRLTALRPWGSYTVRVKGPHNKIKHIKVKPGANLSLQMHHHRSEHWVVVGGMAKIINGDKERLLGTEESTYIPPGHRYRSETSGVNR